MNVQTPIEERWNWLTHGFGFLLSALGLFFLLFNDTHKTSYSTFSILLYSVSLMVLYFASSAYHYTNNVSLKNRFRVMDHISIYLLIAGTYTPVTLIGLLDSKGWLLFILVWSLAGFGSILKLFFTGKFEILSVTLYLVMGWLIMLDITTLTDVVGSEGIMYLMLGGLAYTFGIIFYAFNKLNFNHVIWHVFVLAGGVFHYIFVLKFII
ncbi:hemolysin III family protein [Aquimarina sp. BL5]|uniref:PAQR family membrane homeostasis protein TrhA n=1 Tax=Aquimarina sp. BL5 TaxID=1714860 RepID=UPI000E549A09|nr:hemolysin III family protein [Aquimarina sp. BL5]AXT53748.1 hemolysin III family protein [Aquimarina sp. BL5]RKN03450.1 hemolysin III family protein [Aquimarina sp. BL5]